MKALFKSSYPKATENGDTIEVFVFTVTGTKEEIATYSKDQGDKLRLDDDGIPLFFSSYPTLDYDKKTGVQLYRSTKGKYSLDNSEARRSKAVARTMGAETAYSNAIANRITSTLFGNSGITTESVIKEEDLKDIK
jgi:hypothetical protein